jgi:DNA-binding MarR family transcriptional regulator
MAEVDLAPVVPPDPLDLRNSVTAIVHWADSNVLRLRVMRAVRFPVDDLPMFLVLTQLVYRGALRPSDLAATLGMTPPNISKIARRLEEAGLTVRVPAPGDDRSVLVAMTPAGREVGERIAEAAARSHETALAGWAPDEVEALRRVLAKFARQAIHELGHLSVTHIRRDPEG